MSTPVGWRALRQKERKRKKEERKYALITERDGMLWNDIK